MAELFGAIQRGLGFFLNFFYELVPSYALAIIAVTVASRLLLMPLMVKQMRSMRAMQKIGPQMKEIQKKYKDLQKKVNNRSELQELRLKQNQEVMGLYREHNASPAGGCLPLLAQFPVFIALFSVMRATVFMVALSATTVSGASVPASEYTEAQREATICRPVDAASTTITISCVTDLEGAEPIVKEFQISQLVETNGGGAPLAEGNAQTGFVARCNPILDEDASNTVFACASATGTGHLPREGELFGDVNEDRATILGMHPGCTPNQARTETGLRQCTANETDTGLFAIAPYFILVLLIAFTQYLTGKQMLGRQQPGQQMAQQQLMMTRLMPIFFGFISLSFPTGLNFYYLIFNIWQMGQQHFVLKKLDAEEEKHGGKPKPRKPGLMDRMRDQMQAQAGSSTKSAAGPDEGTVVDGSVADATAAPDAEAKKKPHPKSKKKKRKRKR